MDVLLPLACFELLHDLKDEFGARKVCSKQEVFDRGISYDLSTEQVENLMPLLAKLGAILWFPHVKGAEHLVVLNPQWVVTALTCIVREHNNNHNQLLEALKRDAHDSRPNFHPEDVAYGQFTVELLRYVWSSKQKCYGALGASDEEMDALERVLVQYGLVCEVTILRSTAAGLKPVRCFVVPSLLPEIAPAMYMDAFYRKMRQDSRRHAFSCDFSDTRFLPKHHFERLVSFVVKLFRLQDDEISEYQLHMAQGVASLDSDGLSLVMQHNISTWSIVVNASVCEEFSHGAYRVLQIFTAALQMLGHTTSHKVVLHTKWGDVDLNLLQDAKLKNIPYVPTKSQLSAPTDKLVETWIEPKRGDVSKSAVVPSSAGVSPIPPFLAPQSSKGVVKDVTSGAPLDAGKEASFDSTSRATVIANRNTTHADSSSMGYGSLPHFRCWFAQWKYRVARRRSTSSWKTLVVASSQLEQVYQEWMSGRPADTQYIVPRPSHLLSALWSELSAHKICSVRFQGGHYFAQVTAMPANGNTHPQLELWRQDNDINASTGYPRVWRRPGTKFNVQTPRRVQVLDRLSNNWLRVQHLLRNSLSDAQLVGLERVENLAVWSRFYRQVSIHGAKGGQIALTSREHERMLSFDDNDILKSGVQMLWHATNAIDEICESDIGFDLQYSHVHKLKQALLDMCGWGGHIYGYGAYFAAHAIYSHWWMNNFWGNEDPDAQKGCENMYDCNCSPGIYPHTYSAMRVFLNVVGYRLVPSAALTSYILYYTERTK